MRLAVFFQLRLRLSLQNTAELLNPNSLTQTGTKTGGWSVIDTGELTMKRILNYLATAGAFLYEENGCVISDSEYVDAFGGTGSVTLSNDTIQLKFWLERDRLFMDIRGVAGKKWCSMDIVTELFTGHTSETAEMNQYNTQFLMERFAEIQDRFSSAEIGLMESECDRLEKKRAKEMFG
jgi:hypothetical protein